MRGVILSLRGRQAAQLKAGGSRRTAAQQQYAASASASSAASASASAPASAPGPEGKDVSSIRSAARIGLREEYGAAIGDIEAVGIPTRIRQHVNPLRMEFQRPVSPPEWGEVFREPDLPLVIDIGVRPARRPARHARTVPGRRR